ncbi:DUF1501 domain-containing protein [Singulisphaera sp. Ch08]|uniref:DUF1501 domain-containing protein n=1 Tax=Singulisphaera sp. Ch08 TaxID=3120278 RepID=A0AAU7CIM4_9BACT
MFEKSIVKVAMNGQGVLHRRGFLEGIGLAAAGLATVSFTDMLALQAEELRKRQMACILLWMAGGPSQMETFDPKPDHANGGGIKPIETDVPGILIAPGWERTAKVMKDVALVRSMTNKEGNHERATYQLHTGYPPSGTVKHPSFGCVSANELGDPKFDLPHIVSIGGATIGAGMLGVSLEPFVVQDPTKPPANAVPPVNTARFSRRLGLMQALEQGAFERTGGADRVKDHTALYRQTAGMVLSPRMKAFDLSGEDAKVRAAYGTSAFGQGCLLARRLVDAGVTFVEVRSNGWDTHQETVERVAKNASQVDPGFASLVADLKSRGMLDRTLVIWMGEFGRTPKINPTAGRDHFPRVFNIALAGGGIKGGQVLGASSPDGSEVKDQPIAVTDLLASFCHSLKIDPAKENMSSLGRPIKIVDGGKVVKQLFS